MTAFTLIASHLAVYCFGWWVRGIHTKVSRLLHALPGDGKLSVDEIQDIKGRI